MLEFYDLLSAEDRDAKILEQVAIEYEKGVPVIVYGKSDYANKVRRRLIARNITPIFTIDRPYLQAENSGGGGVIAVEDLTYTDYNLVLGIFAPPKDYQKKFPNARNIYELCTIPAENVDMHISNIMFKDNYELFKQTYNWLNDDVSKSIMKEKLAVNLSADLSEDLSVNLAANLSILGTRYIQEQYFVDIFERADFRSFIDCGAYNGDTFKKFMGIMGQEFDSYIGFEPDNNNYVAFEDAVKQSGYKERVIPINAGVGSKKSKLRFSPDDSASRVSDEGIIEITVLTIDEVIKEQKTTFIKMDIEGMELSALRGAEETIKRDKPNLAICVYHKADDLITIPQFIKSIVPEYQLYLRHHSKFITETVLYAKV